jgi:hypothetical protein
MKMTFQEIRIIATGPGIANQLRDVSTICRRNWYIAAHIWKIYVIYPPELEVKETTDTASSASFLDLYLEFDDSGQISTKIYAKRDDFNFKIINFPNMCSNIPVSPAYGAYIYENPSFIIFSAETEYISTRSWYRNINF